MDEGDSYNWNSVLRLWVVRDCEWVMWLEGDESCSGVLMVDGGYGYLEFSFFFFVVLIVYEVVVFVM